MAGRDLGPLACGDTGTRPPHCGDGATVSPPRLLPRDGALPWEPPAQPSAGQPRSLAGAGRGGRDACGNVSLEEGGGGGDRDPFGAGCSTEQSPAPEKPHRGNTLPVGPAGTGDVFIPPSLLACRGLGVGTTDQPGAAKVWGGGRGAHAGDHPGAALMPITLLPLCCPHPASPLCPHTGSHLPISLPPRPACSPLTSGEGRGLRTSFPVLVPSLTVVPPLSLCLGGIPQHRPQVGSQPPASTQFQHRPPPRDPGEEGCAGVEGSRQSGSLLRGQELLLPAELARRCVQPLCVTQSRASGVYTCLHGQCQTPGTWPCVALAHGEVKRAAAMAGEMGLWQGQIHRLPHSRQSQAASSGRSLVLWPGAAVPPCQGIAVPTALGRQPGHPRTRGGAGCCPKAGAALHFHGAGGGHCSTATPPPPRHLHPPGDSPIPSIALDAGPGPREGPVVPRDAPSSPCCRGNSCGAGVGVGGSDASGTCPP